MELTVCVCLHLTFGVLLYKFLANVFLVVIQSERVLDMFYDMLALNFVSMIDDIAFKLAQVKQKQHLPFTNMVHEEIIQYSLMNNSQMMHMHSSTF